MARDRDPLSDANGKPLKGRAREKAAREQAGKILKRAGREGTWDDEHGVGRLSKAQRKSQESYIGWTDGPQTRAQRIKRNLFG